MAAARLYYTLQEAADLLGEALEQTDFDSMTVLQLGAAGVIKICAFVGTSQDFTLYVTTLDLDKEVPVEILSSLSHEQRDRLLESEFEKEDIFRSRKLGPMEFIQPVNLTELAMSETTKLIYILPQGDGNSGDYTGRIESPDSKPNISITKNDLRIPYGQIVKYTYLMQQGEDKQPVNDTGTKNHTPNVVPTLRSFASDIQNSLNKLKSERPEEIEIIDMLGNLTGKLERLIQKTNHNKEQPFSSGVNSIGVGINTPDYVELTMEARERYWSEYDPADSSTIPNAETIIDWLVSNKNVRSAHQAKHIEVCARSGRTSPPGRPKNRETIS
jgi:hypothetical protein